MKNLCWLIPLVLFAVSFHSCKEFETNDLDDSLFRIKTILEFDNYGEEQSREQFFYDNDQLMFVKIYSNNGSELTEAQKVSYAYQGEQVTAILSTKKNDDWNIKQTCIFNVTDNHVTEKLISRNASPECIACWKYNYVYSGKNLIEWIKYQKDNSTSNWNEYRRVEYIYENGSIVYYKDYENYDNSGLKLDYKREYSVENNKVVGWQGGICVDGCDWVATQKVEYKYEQNYVSTKIYSRREKIEDAWSLFVTINYYYDANNNLIEKTTSSGSQTYYEYEEGLGNAALLYCTPETIAETEPLLKTAKL